MTTAPHPTPEERVEAALKEWRKDAGDLRVHFATAIREAEAAGEARGRSAEESESFQNGFCAHGSGVNKHANPYSHRGENISHREWLCGWETAAALSASGTKSDGGVESRHAKTGNMSGAVPEEEQSLPASGFVRAFGPEDKTSKPRDGVAPIPSDPIPSQPDERERVKQVIESAMIEEAEIQYADFTDRDRQREKIIANAADAILAMQAERRDDERN